MTCARRDMVQPFVDDELDPAAREEFAGHLARCNQCRAAVADSLALKGAVRAAAKRDAAPAALHAAVRRQLQTASPTRWNWQWAAAAAVLVLSVAVGSRLLGRGGDPLLAEAIDQHVIALSSANPVDVISEDRHTVKPWFQGRLPFTFNLPELAGTNVRLLGGKVTYLQQHPAAELLYQAGAHKLSVFVLQQTSPENSSADSSFNVKTWTSHGLGFLVVTDASEAEATRLVSLLQDANR